MEPSEPPPPYQKHAPDNSLHPTRNGIPPQSRRSMEDEHRELPSGWVRQYDSEQHHQFFVDTSSSPPRSIWHHPYDDDTYLSSLSSSERSRIQSLHRVPTEQDIADESTDDEADIPHSSTTAELPPHQQTTHHDHLNKVEKLGRSIKDKLTHSTHQERALQRQKRQEAEQRAYRQHLAMRQAMSKAESTGVPQLLGKDENGKDVFIEPSMGLGGGGGYGGGLFGGYGGNGYGYNPYTQGPYANPNARFVRPPGNYNRPNGYGYGGGYGVPLMGGLAGGLLLTDLLLI